MLESEMSEKTARSGGRESLVDERILDEGLAALAEEIVHELAGSALFFEGLIQSLEQSMEREDRVIADEELSKLRRMLAALRALKFPLISARPEPLLAIVGEVRQLLEPRLAERGMGCELELGLGLGELTTDRELAVRALRVVALQVIARARRDSTLRLSGDRQALRIAAASDGVPEEPPRHLHKATHDRFGAIRWVIANRYARALGWQLRMVASADELAIEVSLVKQPLEGVGNR
jgi:hypothetical protein